jgi:hypothetical protein
VKSKSSNAFAINTRRDSPRDDFLIQNDRERITLISEQNIGSSKCLPSFQLPAGSYKFPFSIPLPGRILETVTCQRQMYHTYHVVAKIERRFRGNSTISRPIRIYNDPNLWVDHQLISTPVVGSLRQRASSQS